MRNCCRNAWCLARPGTLWNACAACSRPWACLDSLLNPMWEEAFPRNASRVPWTCSPTWWLRSSEKQFDGAVAHLHTDATWGETDAHIAPETSRDIISPFFSSHIWVFYRAGQMSLYSCN